MSNSDKFSDDGWTSPVSQQTSVKKSSAVMASSRPVPPSMGIQIEPSDVIFKKTTFNNYPVTKAFFNDSAQPKKDQPLGHVINAPVLPPNAPPGIIARPSTTVTSNAASTSKDVDLLKQSLWDRPKKNEDSSRNEQKVPEIPPKPLGEGQEKRRRQRFGVALGEEKQLVQPEQPCTLREKNPAEDRNSCFLRKSEDAKGVQCASKVPSSGKSSLNTSKTSCSLPKKEGSGPKKELEVDPSKRFMESLLAKSKGSPSDYTTQLTNLLSTFAPSNIRRFADLSKDEKLLVTHSNDIFDVYAEEAGSEMVELIKDSSNNLKFEFGRLRNYVEEDFSWITTANKSFDFTHDSFISCNVYAFVPPRCFLLRLRNASAPDMKKLSQKMRAQEHSLVPLKISETSPGTVCVLAEPPKTGKSKPGFFRVIIMEYVNTMGWLEVTGLLQESENHFKVLLIDHPQHYIAKAAVSELRKIPDEFSTKVIGVELFMARIRGISGIKKEGRRFLNEFARSQNDEQYCAIFGQAASEVPVVDILLQNENEWISEKLLSKGAHGRDDPSPPGFGFALSQFVNDSGRDVEEQKPQSLGQCEHPQQVAPIEKNKTCEESVGRVEDKLYNAGSQSRGGPKFDYSPSQGSQRQEADTLFVFKSMADQMIGSRNWRGLFRIVDCMHDQLAIAKKSGDEDLAKSWTVAIDRINDIVNFSISLNN